MLTDSYELITTEDGVDLPRAELPTALWGYDREAVHEYLERVREAVDEAMAPREPDGAVRQALEQVGQETSAVLQRAHEIAEELTARSQAEARERLERAESEARAIREAAEQRVAELDVELEKLWAERQRLLSDVDRIAEDLRGVIRAADARFPEEVADELGADEPATDVAAREDPAGDDLAADEDELLGEEEDGLLGDDEGELLADDEMTQAGGDDDPPAGQASGRAADEGGRQGAVALGDPHDDARTRPSDAEAIFGPPPRTADRR